MSSLLAIYYFLKSEVNGDSDKWFCVRDISRVVDLSVDRTRRLLSVLVLSGDVETKVDGWRNVYRYRC